MKHMETTMKRMKSMSASDSPMMMTLLESGEFLPK